MAQLTYTEEQDVAFAGLLYDIGFTDIVSGVSQEASASIPFGIVIVRGTIDDGVKLPTAEADIPRGVTVHSLAYEMDVTIDENGVRPKAMINVLRRGRIWVPVETDVVPGDKPHVRYAGTGQAGALRNSAVSGETMDITSQGEFVSTSVTVGSIKLAVLDVNFVNS